MTSGRNMENGAGVGLERGAVKMRMCMRMRVRMCMRIRALRETRYASKAFCFALLPRDAFQVQLAAVLRPDVPSQCTERRKHVKIPSYIWSHRLVYWAPPNLVLRAWFLDNALVQRRTASLGSRVCSQGSCRCNGRPGFVHEGIFVEGGDTWVGHLGQQRLADGRV